MTSPTRTKRRRGGSPFRPLWDATIHYSAQPIALAVAETFELARYAASLVEVEYERASACDRPRWAASARFRAEERRGSARGDADGRVRSRRPRHEAEYRHAFEHHNPMEMHAATVVWEGAGRITVYDKTQGVMNTRDYVSKVFGFDQENVRVIAEYVGGAFGVGSAAGIPVVSGRDGREGARTFGACRSHAPADVHVRPPAAHHSAAEAGRRRGRTAAGVMHDAFSTTSRYEQYTESYIGWSSTLYDPKNLKHSYKLVALDCATPMPMRAPGGSTAVYAIESRDGRARLLDGHRSARAAPPQLRGGEEGQALFEQGATGVLRAGRGAIRLVAPQSSSRARCAKATISSAGVWRRACGRRCARRRARASC